MNTSVCQTIAIRSAVSRRKRSRVAAAAATLTAVAVLPVVFPGVASASPSPTNAVCDGPINYTFSPPLTNTLQTTTIAWSGNYSCQSVVLLPPSVRVFSGTYGGSVTIQTSCLQLKTQQIVQQAVTENDSWFDPGADDPAGTSTLTGLVSTVPREDGTRAFTWTGTVTGGSWFANQHYTGVGQYTSLFDGDVCVAGGVGTAQGTATLQVLPS